MPVIFTKACVGWIADVICFDGRERLLISTIIYLLCSWHVRVGSELLHQLVNYSFSALCFIPALGACQCVRAHATSVPPRGGAFGEFREADLLPTVVLEASFSCFDTSLALYSAFF